MTDSTKPTCQECGSSDLTLLGMKPNYEERKQMGKSVPERVLVSKTYTYRCPNDHKTTIIEKS
ncbi:MAG: hypothetical protein WED34_04825 [Planctomycetales bacterium]